MGDISERQYKRLKKPFVIRFRVRQDEEFSDVFGGWNIVTAEDLSARGTLFIYDQQLEVGAILELKINFPAFENPITCKAKVVRVEQLKHSAFYHVAIMFTAIDGKEKKILNSAVDNACSMNEDLNAADHNPTLINPVENESDNQLNQENI